MTKKSIIAAALILAATGASAQNETMYLVKGDRVIGKYGVDAVDYITFNLSNDIIDENIWLEVDNVGKNTVTYTVNTVTTITAYAHNLLSYYDVNYVAMDMFGDMLDNLTDAEKLECCQRALAVNAFIGMGTQTITQNDFAQWGEMDHQRFNITPGTKYYLCAWEVDPQTQEPLQTFVTKEVETLPTEEINLDLNVEFKASTPRAWH